MNQPGTGSPRPSEISRATQEVPLAIDMHTLLADRLDLGPCSDPGFIQADA